MIVLDTNVVSEMMRPRSDARVMRWLDERPRAHFLLTAITTAEILYGLELAPDGARRVFLEERFIAFVEAGFAGNILPFDEAAARHFAIIAARRRKMGRPISTFDAETAAIAASRGAALATRNVADFEHCGIDVINPWTE